MIPPIQTRTAWHMKGLTNTKQTSVAKRIRLTLKCPFTLLKIAVNVHIIPSVTTVW